FPLDGALLLPGGDLPLQIFEPRYLNMIDDALAAERVIGMVQTVAGGSRDRPRLAQVGCLGKITSFAETPDGRYLVSLTGLCRFGVGQELLVQTPYRQIRAEYAAFATDLKPLSDDDGFDRIHFLTALKAYLDHRQLEIDWEAAREAPCEALVSSLSMALPFDNAEKQALLEAGTPSDRRAALIALLEIDATDDDDEPSRLQ
ncbi:MAG: peptidase, partial [Caulobacteraceae bacterium]|nr:peptidase [Caulobacteraceae bacterium]